MEKGLGFCMKKEEFYMEVLGEYAKADREDSLEKCFAGGDWKNYETIVHGLKSASLTVGAVQLSEEAKELEMAAKEGDTAYIEAHHREMMDRYLILTKDLKRILE